MSVEFLKSEKGKPKLCLSGHLFYKDRQNETKIHWKCQNYRKTKCAARVTTVGNTIVRTWKEHNHCGDAAGVEAAQLLDTIRTYAETTTNTPHSIISNVSRTCSQAAAPKLPSVDTMKRTIRNIRNRIFDGPVIPPHRRDIEEYKTSCNGELFLQFDSGPKDNRMLIFSTKRNLQLLAESEHWYADGTFKTVPLPFYQLCTIHGFKDKVSLPLVHALLPNKSEETYVSLLQQLKILERSMSPRSITMDFETAMMSACRRVFPDALQQGCFFQFLQCIFRSIQNNGLKQRYETDANFALSMKILGAIAFVPTPTVTVVFEHLCETGVFPPESQEVIDYFEDTWIGRPTGRHPRRPPKYPHEMWNVHDLTLKGSPRTNKSVEGWLGQFEKQVANYHLDIWKFVDYIKKELSTNEVRIEQYVSGSDSGNKKKKYRDRDEEIKRLVSAYDEQGDIVDYLRGIAHNISY